MSKYMTDVRLASELEQSAATGGKLFDRLGGREVIARVHRAFYDKVFAHPWLGRYFAGIDQRHIESQQTDFMTMIFGGPKCYGGRMPIDAHEHVMVTEELFAVRRELLHAALVEAAIPPKEMADWLAIDGAFKKVLIKQSVADCRKRFTTDEILDFPAPERQSRAS